MAQFESNSAIKFNLKTNIMNEYHKKIENHKLCKLKLASDIAKDSKKVENEVEQISNKKTLFIFEI